MICSHNLCGKAEGEKQGEGMLLLCKAIIFCDSLNIFLTHVHRQFSPKSSSNSCPAPFPAMSTGQRELISSMGRGSRQQHVVQYHPIQQMFLHEGIL